MKKYISVLAALSIVPAFALAQSLESDVDYELDQLYAETASSSASSDNNVRATTVNTRQPIVILNQAPSAAAAVQKQPVAEINDTPLKEGRAERLRRARQDAEIKTEQKIVEKLEASRMEDEKKRAAILFGDKFNNLENQQQQAAQPVPVQQVPVYTPPVAEAPVQTQVVEEPKENTRDIIREELSMALKTEKEVPMAPIESKYVAGVLGVGDVPDASNVQGNYAMGIAVGSQYDNFILEGSFLFSNYTVGNQGYYVSGHGGGFSPYNYVYDSIDVKQYSGSLAAKVQLFDGMIRPVFGGVVAYSYRDFAWDNKTYYRNDAKANSHAIDVGTVIGADLQFTPKYTVGLDFRYMWNLSSRVNAGANWWSTTNDIEKFQYYIMSINGRVNF